MPLDRLNAFGGLREINAAEQLGEKVFIPFRCSVPTFVLDKLVVRTQVHGQWFPAVGADREQLSRDFHIFLPLDHFTNHGFVIKGLLTARLTALEQTVIALRIE